MLEDAQKLGLAEPDPSSDVEGLDAAYKLSIMASLAFHARVPFKAVYREGITQDYGHGHCLWQGNGLCAEAAGHCEAGREHD